MEIEMLRQSFELVAANLQSKIDFASANESLHNVESECFSGDEFIDDDDDDDDVFQDFVSALTFEQNEPFCILNEYSKSSYSSTPPSPPSLLDDLNSIPFLESMESFLLESSRHQSTPEENISIVKEEEPGTPSSISHSESESSDGEEHGPRRPKKSPTHGVKRVKPKRRKRKNLLKPGSQLYQFILQLLDDETLSDYIKWVDHENGLFRIINKQKVATLWGSFKNREMSYDSLSRGLRHYYGQGLLNSVRKKLHYQFTQKALEEWEQIRDKDSIEDDRD